MPHNEDLSGLGEFAQPAGSVLASLRRRRVGERATLARATSRVRTSGVRFIPQRTLEAGAESRELGFLGNIGIQAALSRIRDRRLREQRTFQAEQNRLGFGRSRDLSRTLARRQLQSQLISGVGSGFLSLFGGGGQA